MPLRSTFWNTNVRLQRGAENNPSVKAFDPDKPAVTLLQQAFARTAILPAIKVDGIYGQQTAGAARSVQNRFNMDKDQGASGRQVLGIVDILLQSGRLCAELALLDVPLAQRKVRAAITALNTFVLNRSTGTPPNGVTVNALRTHFRLTVTPSTIGVTRQVTNADLTLILGMYNQINNLFTTPGPRMRSGVPVNGLGTPAEAPLNGPIRFGPAYTDVNSHFGNRIGPNSRAAILIHEAVHVFDGISGNANIHISEFDPAYDVQSADLSLHNPSSYAGFAAHIDNGSDPIPRFGLGAAQGS